MKYLLCRIQKFVPKRNNLIQEWINNGPPSQKNPPNRRFILYFPSECPHQYACAMLF